MVGFDFSKKSHRIFAVASGLFFLIPLGIFYFIYNPVMNYCQEHYLQPLYVYMMSRDVSFDFALNIRILLKGFIFTVLLCLCWFPFTLAARYLYYRLILNVRKPGLLEK